MSKTRVVVTGYGAVCSVGNSIPEIWESLRNGRSGIAKLNDNILENMKDNPTHYGGELKNFDPQMYFEKSEIRKMDRLSIMSCVAATECVERSGIRFSEQNKYKYGCIVGVGLGGIGSFLDSAYIFKDKGWKRVPIMTISKIIPNSASSVVSLRFNKICGANYTINTACSSGTDAIGAAARHIIAGDCDFVLAGGSETTMRPFVFSGFNVIHALSTKWNDDPQKASRPFDKNRDGFVMSEGSAIIALESLDHAQKRGANILAELVGFSNINDAYHYTAPEPTGLGITKAIQNVLHMADIDASAVNYINAHGTSTPTNDSIETKAIKSVFKDHAYKLKISSTKSMTGHCIGATGALESIVCIKSIEDQFVPPTINLDIPDPECDLDYVPHKGIAHNIDYALSTTLGFGGHNGTVLFKKFT